jgi:hypothetical protein
MLRKKSARRRATLEKGRWGPRTSPRSSWLRRARYVQERFRRRDRARFKNEGAATESSHEGLLRSRHIQAQFQWRTGHGRLRLRRRKGIRRIPVVAAHLHRTGNRGSISARILAPASSAPGAAWGSLSRIGGESPSSCVEDQTAISSWAKAASSEPRCNVVLQTLAVAGQSRVAEPGSHAERRAERRTDA